MLNTTRRICAHLTAIAIIGFSFFAIQGCLCQPIEIPSSSDPISDPPASTAETELTFLLTTYPNASAAFSSVLKKTNPRAIGFGEFHQQNDTTHVLSALERFSSDLLPLIGTTASDLVVETWFSKGNCGESEKQVVKQVDKVSERPAETENETIRLLKQSKALGIQPHILEIECGDYDAVRDPDGGVDYLELLELIGSRLGDKAERILSRRNSSRAKDDSVNKAKRNLIAIYGGAIHNDVSPQEGFEGVSFASSLKKNTGEHYIEIDLLVPEFVETSELLKQEPWFSAIRGKASPDSALLIELSPESYAIIFRRDVANK